MATGLRREALVLFVGDILFLIVSLWVTLLVRYAALPSWHLFHTHLVPFSFLFLLSTLTFLIAGLYDKHTLLVKSKLPETVLYAQIANVVVGVLLFFFVPYFGITPKTNLFLYLVFSTALISLWRVYLFPSMAVSAPQAAVLVGRGPEADEVMREVNGNTRYTIRFAERLEPAGDDFRAALADAVRRTQAGVVVVPFSLLGMHTASGAERELLAGVEYVDLEELYEELFDRVALPLVGERWLLEAASQTPTRLYDAVKRLIDIALSVCALVVLSPFLVVIAFALLPSGSPLIFQKRVGKNGRVMSIIKFRTMLFDDGEDPEKKKLNRITRFGAFLRKTQLDEVPQFWNVLRGDLSLIGPRPEIPHFVEAYEREIPYYGARHLIQPGISGWAQVRHASPPKFRLDVSATENKLSYDLYYFKHRSLLLDTLIILQTIKILAARASK
jgi:lipopolysaccharide/colanic/teichoic acid biosynthesis glycosyltransferase